MTATNRPDSGRTVIGNVVMSLDGCVAADPSDGAGGMGWLLEHAVHPATRAHFEGIYRGADTALMGRANHDGFSGYWPPVADDPQASPRDRAFSIWLNEVEKVVFSRTVTSSDWANTRMSADLEAEVRALRFAPGRDILVLSSSSIIRGLLAADLLDELHIGLLPAVLGTDQRLFPTGTAPATLRLLGTTTFPSGGVGLHYGR